MFVYKITNTINSKVYIGQTIRPIKQRFQRHINDATNNIIDTHFARAIRKYGSESFKIELIDQAQTQEELTKKEQYWIQKYKSTESDYGYNETDAICKCGGNTYRAKSIEEMNDIKTKIRNSKLGNKNPNACGIKCFNIVTNQELRFSTVEECQKHFGESTHRFITTRVTGKVQGLFRNEWKIAYLDKEYFDFFPAHHKKGTGLKIYDPISNKVTWFDSVRLACRTLHLQRNEIQKHLRNNETEFIVKNYIITVLS